MSLMQDPLQSRDPFRLVERAWSEAEVPAFAFDPEGRFRYGNEAFAQLVGWKPDPFYGRRPPLPWWEESETERTRRQLDAWVGGEMGALGVAGVQSLLRHRSGRVVEIVVTGTAVRDEESRPIVFLGVAAEIGAGGDEPAAQAGLREAAEHLMKTAELVQRALLAGGSDAGEARLARVPGVGSLSSREREVLRRLGDGLRVSPSRRSSPSGRRRCAIT